MARAPSGSKTRLVRRLRGGSSAARDGAAGAAVARGALRVLRSAGSVRAALRRVRRAEQRAGRADPWNVYAVLQHSPEAAARIGAAVGAILAEQHSCIAAREVAGWLPLRPSWPESREWIRARLPGVIDDAELQARADDLMCVYEELAVGDDDRVLAHTDVGLHNLAIDPDSYDVRGVFDYEGAAWADRHHDFRYLVLDADRYELLDSAAAVYERAAGHSIDRERVLLYNAVCALSFLAFRAGHRADERWCGRTLHEDLRWSKLAIGRVHSGSASAAALRGRGHRRLPR